MHVVTDEFEKQSFNICHVGDTVSIMPDVFIQDIKDIRSPILYLTL